MRGTLHLLPSAELGVWLAALGTFASRGNSGYPRIEALVDAVRPALEGRVLTREDLARGVERITGDPELGEWVRFSWGSYLKAVSFRGALCFGPSQGSRVRFTSPATWVPDTLDKTNAAEGLRAVAHRFMAAYAPVTVDDFARWWGDGRRPGARMLAALGEEAVEVDVEGQRAWVLAGDLPNVVSAKPPQAARLLPAFDPWVIGALIGKPTSFRCDAIVREPGHRRRIFSAQGWVSPVLLVDGQIVGVWKHTRQGRSLQVEIEPFGTLPDWATAQIEAEVERLGRFLGGAHSLTWQAPRAPQNGI
jgi:hypothetical protein